MSKHGAYQWLAGLGSLCLIILFFDPRYNNLFEHRIQPTLAPVNVSTKGTKQVKEVDTPSEKTGHIEKFDASPKNTWKHIIDLQRKLIRQDMKDYQYPKGKYNVSARSNCRKLKDLVIEKNGRPIRSIILSTWRSGSSFFGALLDAHPGNFHHFEPLLEYGVFRIRGPPLAATALKKVKALLNCEYGDQDELIKSGKYYWAFNRNTRLWKQCQAHKSFCHDHRFLTAMCKLFPFQSMKLVRLRLYAARELLADKRLAIRMVLLVRDPRGTLQSRKHVSFCQNGPDCSESALLCADLVSDYEIAVELQKKYPTTFRVLRYEDLAIDPYTQMKEISKFYGRDFHPNVKKFLDTHTTTDTVDKFDTSRNSKAAPFHWRTKFNFEEVEEIQRSCATAMKYWGYLPAMNASHQKDFIPVTDYLLNV